MSRGPAPLGAPTGVALCLDEIGDRRGGSQLANAYHQIPRRPKTREAAGRHGRGRGRSRVPTFVGGRRVTKTRVKVRDSSRLEINIGPWECVLLHAPGSSPEELN